MTSSDEHWWSPFRVIDGITVIQVDLAPDAAHEKEAFACLDRNEKDRWRRYRVERARRQFALCRAALRANLCEKHGCMNDQLSFGFLEHGKPFAIVDGMPSRYSFNVSHSGTHGLIAFAPRGQLGVDAEERLARPTLDGIIETVFGPSEQAALARVSGNRKIHLFFSLWTMKEALIKALGTGFSLDPSGFEVPLAMLHGMKSGIFRFPHAPAVKWRIQDLGETRFAAAIAYELDPRDNSAVECSAGEPMTCRDSVVDGP